MKEEDKTHGLCYVIIGLLLLIFARISSMRAAAVAPELWISFYFWFYSAIATIGFGLILYGFFKAFIKKYFLSK